MNKTDLINALAAKKDLGLLSKHQTDRIINSLIETINIRLKKDKKVQLFGLGTFYIRQRAARWGMNPNTRQRMKIKASKVVKFNPCGHLRTLIKKA